MSARFLLGILTSGLSNQNSQMAEEQTNISEKVKPEGYEDIIVDFQTPAKFHIGMLTLSLITGLAYGGYIIYNCWMEKNIFLGYIRNLIIALVCRTFFTVVFDGAILLESPLNVGGGNALLSFEQICLNLVLAFWLTFTIYMHARVQRNFNSEPTLRLYQYGVPGVAVFFAFVWIFTLQGEWPSIVWWLFLNPFTQWITNSLNLLFLLIQLALVADIIRMIMKISLDNDTLSLLRKVGALMGVLVLIFWLQFGLSIGRDILRSPKSYIYFFYFIDGLECALVCLVSYFFNKWVLILVSKMPSMMTGSEEMPARTPKSNEVLLSGNGGRGIVSTNFAFMTCESGRWKNSEEEGMRDVVYSNVVEPERLKKTLELYKRLNIISGNQVTVFEGEEFYDCQKQGSVVSEDAGISKLSPSQLRNSISSVSQNKALCETTKFQTDKVCQHAPKKNAFYSSKYLILDSKESDIPKYLETRPSISSMSEKDSPKEELVKKDLSDLDSLMSDELVRKWLRDNSENMQRVEKNNSAHQPINKEKKLKSSNAENFILEIPKVEAEVQTPMHSLDPRLISDSKQDSSKDEGNFLNKKENTNPGISEKMNVMMIVECDSKDCTENKKGLKLKKPELQHEEGINNEDKHNNKQEPEVNSPELNLMSDSTISKKTKEIEKGDAPGEIKDISSKEHTANKSDTESESQADLSLSKIQEALSSSVTEENKEVKDDTQTDATKLSNQFLTYSELLEFRSKRDKLKTSQLPEATTNFFSFSGTISSTISSLINAGSNLFGIRKDSLDTNAQHKTEIPETEKNDNLERKELQVSQNKVNAELKGITDLELESKSNNNMNTTVILKNLSDNYIEPQNFKNLSEKSKSLELQPHGVLFAKKTGDIKTDDIPSPTVTDIKTDDVSSTPVTDIKTNNVPSPSVTDIKTDDVSSTPVTDIKTNNVPSPSVTDIKLQSGQSLSEELKEVLVLSDTFWGQKPKSNLPTAVDVKNEPVTSPNQFLTSSELSQVYPKQNKLLIVDKTTNNSEPLVQYEYQSKILDIKNSNLNLQNKAKQEHLRKLDLLNVNKIETDVPFNVQKSNVNQSGNKIYSEKAAGSLKNSNEITEMSSDSEFSIERKKNSSSSSSSSFSLDQYYAKLMETRTKYNNQQNPVYNAHRKRQKY